MVVPKVFIKSFVGGKNIEKKINMKPTICHHKKNIIKWQGQVRNILLAVTIAVNVQISLDNFC